MKLVYLLSSLAGVKFSRHSLSGSFNAYYLLTGNQAILRRCIRTSITSARVRWLLEELRECVMLMWPLHKLTLAKYSAVRGVGSILIKTFVYRDSKLLEFVRRD
jgi:hypothetical protein